MWSNGQTEGQITKLKLIKRQMYGRGKLDLLEARIVGRPDIIEIAPDPRYDADWQSGGCLQGYPLAGTRRLLASAAPTAHQPPEQTVPQEAEREQRACGTRTR